MTEISRLPGPVMDLWDWQYQGACRTADPTLFFHPEGERGSARRRRADAAKAICQGCPVLQPAELDLGTAVLAVDHLVADGDVERDPIAVVVDATRADGQDLALLGLFLRGVRNDQTRGRRLLRVEGPDNDPVLERLDGDRHSGPPLHMSWFQWFVVADLGRPSSREPADPAERWACPEGECPPPNLGTD